MVFRRKFPLLPSILLHPFASINHPTRARQHESSSSAFFGVTYMVMRLRFFYAIPVLLLFWRSHDLVYGAPASPAFRPILHVNNATSRLVQAFTTTAVHVDHRLVLDYTLEGHSLSNRLAALTMGCIDEAYHATRARVPGSAPFTGAFAFHAPMQVHLAPSPVPAVAARSRLTNDEAALAWLMLSDVVVKQIELREIEFDVHKEGKIVARGKVLKV